MARITVTFEADLNHPDNRYSASARQPYRHFGEAVADGVLRAGDEIHVEISTGDAVWGTLVSVEVQN